jgi:hypothetical protein
MSFVPDDLLALICCQLNLKDFLAAASVCRSWYAAARKKAAWPKTRTMGPLVFDDRQCVQTPDARPLSQTIWASCTSVSYHDRHGFECLGRAWLGKVSAELVEVSTLSFVIRTPHSVPSLAELSAPLFSRLTSLRTNQVTLVQATSRERLVHLAIVPCISLEHERDWLELLPTLSNLTHVTVDLGCYYYTFWFGKELARLADTHHTLQSITLPTSHRRANHVLQALQGALHFGSPTPVMPVWNLSSIRVLTNVPDGFLHTIFTYMPCLVTYACSPPNWLPKSEKCHQRASDNEPRLESLACSSADLWLTKPAWLAHLTHLDIYDLNGYQYDTLIVTHGPFLRLIRLCLPPGGHRLEERQIDMMAPHLTQLSMCESMLWGVHINPPGDRYRASPCVANLCKLARLEHLELFRYVTDEWKCTNDTTVITRTLLYAMVQSPCWRKVTCTRVPAAIRLDDQTECSPEQLALVRWHVVDQNKDTLPGNGVVVYRPHIHVARWRSWIGLRARQVVWERV